MNNISFENIGDFIRDLRKERDLTIEEVAKYIGVTKAAISQWENGKGIKSEMLYALARFFDVSVDELIEGKRNGESSNDFIKRNYDLSLFEFDENHCDEKTGDEYFSKLKRIKTRFFSLLRIWTFDEMTKSEKEEFDFWRQYFESDKDFLDSLNYESGIRCSYNDKDIKEMIRNQIIDIPSSDGKGIEWELQKFYRIKPEYLKSDLICKTKSNDLLVKLLQVMNQPEKDIFFAWNLSREETQTQGNGFFRQEIKTKRDLTINEIERNPYLKTMLNNGCNCMKEYKLPSCIEKEDLDHLEGEVYGTVEEISFNDDLRPYQKGFGGNELVGSLHYWKTYSYKQYQSFIDTKKTEYYKALVNLKDTNPMAYYDALKKYYGGE